MVANVFDWAVVGAGLDERRSLVAGTHTERRPATSKGGERA
ncbi:hypothetical protein ABN028_22300 [Actinopolymorpha sp. B17G11]